MFSGFLCFKVYSELRATWSGFECRLGYKIWDLVYGCDVCLELREEALGEVGFECVVLELVHLLVVEFLGVYGCVGVDVIVFSEADEG